MVLHLCILMQPNNRTYIYSIRVPRPSKDKRKMELAVVESIGGFKTAKEAARSGYVALTDWIARGAHLETL